MTDQPVLEVTGVTKEFLGVRALHQVSFTLLPGEVHALVGENGAGKSTLIKILTGVYQPDAGQVRYLGEPVSFSRPLDAQQAGISTIYQEVNLVPLMSVAANLFLGREPRNRFGLIDFGRMYAEASTVLADYGVPSGPADVRRPLATLGVGAQQMVALARAVMVDARVVIMDEPTSSLEPREVETLFRVIGDLRERGIALIYVSHRMAELYRLCDRVTVLRDGMLVHTGPLAELPRRELIAQMLGRDLAQARSRLAQATTEHDDDEEPVLLADDLTGRRVLNGVSLAIRRGEVAGLAGLLGSGRSETARAIAGAFPLAHGTVVVAGRTLRRHHPAAAIRAGVSLLTEDRKADGIVPHLSIRENIVLAALPQLSRFGLVSRAKQDRVVRVFMDRLRIKAAGPEQRVSELSGGNQQKVLLARWLCMKPTVLLLDEPTRGIDVGAKAEVQTLIRELADEGIAVLLISSELDELLDNADRLVVLREGTVVGELTGDEINEPNVMAALAAHTDQVEVTDG